MILLLYSNKSSFALNLYVWFLNFESKTNKDLFRLWMKKVTFSDSSAWPLAQASSLSFSMKGTRCATAFFITRADLITCVTTREKHLVHNIGHSKDIFQESPSSFKTPLKWKLNNDNKMKLENPVFFNCSTCLRQEHLSGTEKVSDDGHAAHKGTLDDVERTRITDFVLSGLFSVIHDELVDALEY